MHEIWKYMLRNSYTLFPLNPLLIFPYSMDNKRKFLSHSISFYALYLIKFAEKFS